MNLKLGNFHVRDVVFGPRTTYRDGVLTINREEAIARVMQDRRILKCELEIVHPGDSVRLIPVKGIMEARCKPGEEPNTFPGFYGTPLRHVGEGVTHCLKDMCVTTVGKIGHFSSGVMDMGGEGAKHSWYSQLINVCLVLETSDEREEQKTNPTLMEDASHHLASIALAEYLGQTVRELTPDEYEEYDFDPILKPREELKDLPKVVFVMVTGSNGQDFMNQKYYGWPMRHPLPFLVSPTMILDGALSAEPYHVPAMGQYNIDSLNSPVLKRLCREHGKTINLVGVILTNDNTELTCKQRSTQIVVETCRMLGVDGAVVWLSGYGNPYVDYIKTIAALRKAGIVAAGITLECSGRDGRGQPYTVTDPAADMLVSTGNVSEVTVLPPVERVVGDQTSIVRDPASGAWQDDPVYGPSLRPDGSIVVENNCIVGACSAWGCGTKTVKEF